MFEDREILDVCEKFDVITHIPNHCSRSARWLGTADLSEYELGLHISFSQNNSSW